MIEPAPLVLTCHPATPCPDIHAVTAAVWTSADGGLAIRYRVVAAAGRLLVPPPLGAPDQATDGLWRHTCCEIFLAREGATAYREFNFSPSGQWASYAFAATRQRDPASESAWRKRPEIAFTELSNGFELLARLQSNQLPPGDAPLAIGLSAVLETRLADAPSSCSYWALHHPAAQPDFHHPASFAHSLTPNRP